MEPEKGTLRNGDLLKYSVLRVHQHVPHLPTILLQPFSLNIVNESKNKTLIYVLIFISDSKIIYYVVPCTVISKCRFF